MLPKIEDLNLWDKWWGKKKKKKAFSALVLAVPCERVLPAYSACLFAKPDCSLSSHLPMVFQ